MDSIVNVISDNSVGSFISDNKSFLKVTAQGGYINILELQQAGKKRMSVTDFLKGFQVIES